MPASLLIQPEPLTAETFAPYGEVIEIRNNNQVIPINYGMTDRHHNLATVDTSGSQAIISLFKTQPVTLPFQINVIERHPLGSQAFMPLSNQPYLVVVAPAGDFDYHRLRAFLATPKQGINYHRGTWHHYCLALNSVSEFLVIDRKSQGDNCDEVHIPHDITIRVQT